MIHMLTLQLQQHLDSYLYKQSGADTISQPTTAMTKYEEDNGLQVAEEMSNEDDDSQEGEQSTDNLNDFVQ